MLLVFLNYPYVAFKSLVQMHKHVGRMLFVAKLENGIMVENNTWNAF